jgi:hypothetical protein
VVENALALFQPYVLGEKSHREHACSRSQYDKDRALVDPAHTAPWDPDTARTMFRHARLAFTNVRPWTSRYITEEYAPWFKVYFRGKGDALQAPAP